MKPIKKKRSPFLYISLSALLLLVGFLPQILSTEFGKNVLLSLANRVLPGTVDIKTLSLSWSGPQEIEEMHYTKKEEDLSLHIPKIEMEASLFSLLRSSHPVGTIQITNPSCKLSLSSFSPSSTTSEMLAASMLPLTPHVKMLQKNFLSFTGKIIIKEGNVELISKTVPSLFVHIPTTTLTVEKKTHTTSCHIELSGRQDELQGTLLLDGLLQFAQDPSLQLEATVVHFPCQGLSPFFIGETIDLHCNASLSSSHCSLDLQINSSPLQGSFHLISDGEKATLQSPAYCQVDLSKLGLVPHPWTLDCSIEQLSFPLSNWKHGSFTTTLSSSPYLLQEGISVMLQGELSSSILEDKVLSDLQIQIKQGKTSSTLTAQVTADALFLPSYQLTGFVKGKNIPVLAPYIPLLGEWATIDCELRGNLAQATVVVQEITTPYLHIPTLSLLFANNKLSIQETKEPLSYKLHTLSPSLVLQEPATLSLFVSECTIDPVKPKLSCNLNIPTLTFQNFFSWTNYTLEEMNIACTVDSFSKISLTAQGPRIALSSLWSVDREKKQLSLLKPCIIDYQMQDSDLPFFLPQEYRFAITKTVPLQLTLSPTLLSLEEPLLPQLSLDGTLSCKELPIAEPPITFANTSLLFSFLGKIHSLHTTIQSTLQTPGIPEGKILLTTQHIEQVLQKADLSLQKISLPLVDKLSLFPEKVTPLLGATLDASLLLEKQGDLTSLFAQITTPFLLYKGGFSLEPQAITLNKKSPLLIEYTLTPQGYESLASLLPPSPFHLQEPADFQIHLRELLIPRSEKTKALDFLHTQVVATFTNKQMVFSRANGIKALELSETKFSLQKTSQEDNLAIVMDAKAASGFLHIDGKFHPEQQKALLLAKLEALPCSLLDIAVPSRPNFFSTLLGNSFNLQATLQIEKRVGPFSLQFQSPTAYCSLRGLVNQTDIILQENSKASLSISWEASEALLQLANNPLPLQSFFTTAPITLEIYSKGFSWPITNPFSVEKIALPNVKINFGKIKCKNEGGMQQALKFFRSKSIQDKNLELWVAPLEAHMKEGILEIERTEILLDKTFEIPIWGNINFSKRFVDMGIGLTADTLRKSLGIKKLPSDYVLKIPLKGPFDAVSVNTGIASSKIAALMLWQSQALEKGLGPIGGILKQVIPPPGGDSSVPPPKMPFPWQK